MPFSETRSVINYFPLTTTPDTPVSKAIALMSQTNSSCLIVLATEERDSPLVGLFTERDVVQLIANGMELANLAIASVMTTQLITITESEVEDILAVINLLRKHRIRHLPIVGKMGNLVGILTETALLEAINPLETHQAITALQNLVDSQKIALDILNEKLKSEVNNCHLLKTKILTSEAKMRAIFAAMRDTVIIVNIELREIKDFDILPTNLSNESEFNSTLIEQTITQFFQPETSVIWLKKVQQALEIKQNINFDYGLNVAGSEVWFTTTISPISDNSVLWVARDISDRYRIEKELRASEASLAIMQRVAHIGSWELDIKTQENVWSEELFRICGFQPTGKFPKYAEVINLVHPDDRSLLEQAIEQAIYQKKPYILEHRIVLENGEIRYLESRGEPIINEAGEVIKLQGTAMDITLRKQAEEAWQKSEVRFEKLVANIPGGVYELVQHLDGSWDFEYISQAIEQIQEIKLEKIIDNPNFIFESFHPDDVQGYNEAVAISAQNLTAFFYEWRMMTPNGKIKWVQGNSRPERRKNGEMIWYGVVFDVSDRKTLERKLALREALLNDFFYSAPVGLNIVDDQLRYLKINQHLAEINGLPAAEHIGKTFHELISKIAPDLEKLYQQVLTTSQPIINLEISGEVPSQPGIIRDWVVSLFPIAGEDSHLQGVGTVVVEVTERNQVEKALRESAKREQALSQVIKKMRQTLELPEIFAATTNELRKLLDCDRVTIYRFHPDWSGEFVAESVADGWISLLEAQHENPHLISCLLKNENCVIKNLEQAVAFNGNSSYLVLDNIYEANLINCQIELLEIFQAKAYISVPIYSGNKLWGLLAVHQNFTPRQWQEAEINVVVQIGNQLAVALQQSELLTQTQRQSLELIKAKEAAEAANNAKSQFLAKMSHELRTPLNAILGFSQILAQSKSVAPEQREHLEIIKRSGEHLLNLINDILSMAKIESGQTTLNEKCFNLEQLLETLKDLLQFKANAKGLKLLFEIAPEVPLCVETDESKLRQVLINLLDNAIKFTQTGTVTLTVNLKQKQSDLRLEDHLPYSRYSRSQVQPGNDIQEVLPPVVEDLSLKQKQSDTAQIIFIVKDTGPGISPDEISNLFQPFAQTQTGRQTGQGTGLGLAISQQFIKLMGGDISVESQLGVGTSFTFYIQVKLADTAEEKTAFTTRQVIGLEPNQATYRILIVEDVKENRQLLVKLLAPLGFELREAENGQQAITIWESWQPHLIWMDMLMPVMDGYESARQIKAQPQGKNTVIIALTASAFEEQRPAILKAGCDDFMPKPFRSEVLFEKIAKYLGVRYIYEDNSPFTFDSSASQPKQLTLEHLSRMPKEWVEELYRAAETIDDSVVTELIQQLPETEVDLIDTLIYLVDNFRLDIIFNLTESYLNNG